MKRPAWLLLLTVLLAGAPLPAQEQEWREKLSAIDRSLRATEYSDAAARARKLTAEMLPDLGTGPAAAYTLAVTTALRAIAEEGRGDHEAAAWFWQSAQQIFPDVIEADTSPYGEPARHLKELPLRQLSDRENLRRLSENLYVLEGIDPTGFEPPTLLHRPKVEFPEKLRRMGIEESYEVEVVLGLDGRCREPVVVTPVSSPAMAFVVLESLRETRFTPAKAQGEPVRAYYTLKVTFDIRTKQERREAKERRDPGKVR